MLLWVSLAAASSSLPYVEGRLIVTLKPGSTASNLESLNRKYQGRTIRKLPVANTYLVEVPSKSDSAQVASVAASGAADAPRALDWYVERYRTNTRVRSVSPDYLCKLSAVPSDPRYGEQWGLDMIGMPAAWDLEKGSAGVTVAVVDNGVSLSHPDLMSRLVLGWDAADRDNDPSPPAASNSPGHGTHVAGTIAADTDNGIGVAGVCWQGVKIMPIKVFPDSAPDGAPWSAIIDGLDYAMTHGASVVNMSLGGSLGTDAAQEKIRQLDAMGILVVCSAGNEYRGPVSYPAAYEECIAVSAVGRDGQLAFYSNVGIEVDIAAPGGSGYCTDCSDAILSTWWDPTDGNDYRSINGTSMASPHVAGACALLLSAGVPAEEVKQRLYEGSAPAGTTSPPNREYGWGIVNVPGAFSGEVSILQPATGEEIETSTPTFVMEVKRVSLGTVAVYVDFADLDNDGKPDPGADETPVINGTNLSQYYDEGTHLITFDWPVGGRDPLSAGKHRVYIEAQGSLPNAPVASDSAVFFVRARVQRAGLSMFAVPCAIRSDTDEDLTFQEIEAQAELLMSDLLGDSGFALSRWDPLTGGYAVYDLDSGRVDPAASFNPPGVIVHSHGDSRLLRTPPAGVGYWLLLDQDRSMLISGTTDRTRGYDIRLFNGWNMVGNPFAFKVDWNNAVVTFQGRTVTLADAVSRQWVSGTMYRYASNGYVAQTAPKGVMAPWEAVWVKVKGDTSSYGPLWLTIPPIPSQGAVPGSLALASTKAASASAYAAAGSSAASGWLAHICATAGDLSDPNGAIGQRPGAADGYGPEDVESPPLAPRCVEVRFPHNDWGANSGCYDRDIRAPFQRRAGRAVWDFEVVCTEPKTEVVLNWPDIGGLPPGYGLFLRDELTGEALRLMDYNRYAYTTGSSGSTRRFSLCVVPRMPAPLRLTDVKAQVGAGGIICHYRLSADATLQATVRDRGGNVVRALGPETRPAGRGRLYWDGRLSGGARAARGVYAICLEATNAFGDKALARCTAHLGGYWRR